jgi:RimJ/RimL family protein N-acetyltransferase
LQHARGRGIAAQATTELARWCFDDLELHRLVITHSSVNIASCMVAIKASFPYEGTMVSQLRHADGWHDMHIHGRISCRSDYPAR